MEAIRLAFALMVLGVLPWNISGKIMTGQLSSGSENWKFMTRFCFISMQGKFEFYFEYPEEYADQDLLLYYDQIWLPVYTDEMSNCSAKKGVLSEHLGQIITLSPSYTYKCHNFKKPDGSNWINCTDSRTFRTARERWWFFVLASCETPKGLHLTYRLHMTNGQDWWNKEFSADEILILPIVIVAFFLMVIQLALSIFVGIKLASKQLFHTTYKMYITSMGFYTFHLFLQLVAYWKYANDGLPDSFHGTKLFGRLIEAISRLIFLLKLILMAKGFTITRGRLSRSGSIKVAVFMTLYTILYAVVFIWESEFFDEGKVLYFYESIPGYCIIGLRVLSWLWFVYAIIFTLKHYPEKRVFYAPYAVLYTVWFWASPVVVLIAVTAMAKWTREKTVVGVECAIAFFGYLFFLVITWPSLANRHFPFHVRTTQIDVMTDVPHVKESDMGFPSDGGVNAHSTTNYTLTQSERTSGPNFTELFTVSHTRSRPDENLIGKTRHGQLPPLNARLTPSAPALTLDLPD